MAASLVCAPSRTAFRFAQFCLVNRTLVAALPWLIGGLNMWQYFGLLGGPPMGRIAVFTVPALLFAVAVWLFFALSIRRGAWWSALLAFPAMWVSFEYLFRNLVSPHGTAGNLSLFAVKFPARLPTRFCHRPLGHHFSCDVISRRAHRWPASSPFGAPKQAVRIVGVATALGAVGLVLIFGVARLSTASVRAREGKGGTCHLRRARQWRCCGPR